MSELKNGDLVWLTELALSKDGLGGREYVPNPVTKKLLQGCAMEVFDTVSIVSGSDAYSVRFEGGSYSLSVDHFELASVNKRKLPLRIQLRRFYWELCDFFRI